MVEQPKLLNLVQLALIQAGSDIASAVFCAL